LTSGIWAVAISGEARELDRAIERVAQDLRAGRYRGGEELGSGAVALPAEDAGDEQTGRKSITRAAIASITGRSREDLTYCKDLERVERIELSSSAWKAVALPLSYTRARGVISSQ
jgi:hypothetical protein